MPRPNPKPLTADTITDAEIRAMRQRAEQPGFRDNDVATITNRALGDGTAWRPFGLDRAAARARCAEILNERAREGRS